MSKALPTNYAITYAIIVSLYLVIGFVSYKILVPRLKDKSKKPSLLRYTWIVITLLPLVSYILKKIVELIQSW